MKSDTAKNLESCSDIGAEEVRERLPNCVAVKGREKRGRSYWPSRLLGSII